MTKRHKMSSANRQKVSSIFIRPIVPLLQKDEDNALDTSTSGSDHESGDRVVVTTIEGSSIFQMKVDEVQSNDLGRSASSSATLVTS